ncbi:hypothetical protein SLE2022_152920 [Rubroshorea leprosula]
MRCAYGLAIPASDTRFFTPEPFLRLPRPGNPSRISVGSFRIKAKINEARKETSFYELLGIPESGTLLEVKQAYKQLARKYHPDVSPPDQVEENTERFIQVQEAYETLSDPRRRAIYDRDLSMGLHLAFSARRRSQYHERSEWKNRWQSQLSELKRRSMNKDAKGNLSWGAQVRRQREEASKKP